jgi:hypothetical protein
MASQQIYRYKFRQDFLDVLVEFSRVHQYDAVKEFKEAFETFCENNKEIIEKETTYLTDTGYSGDIIKKIYISARYYFKNKDYKPQETKQRRKYISQDKDFIYSIDEHVLKAIRNKDKPAKAYGEFMDNHEGLIDTEKNRLQEFLDTDEAIGKIKKTYKNRYFIQQKHFEDA